MSTRTFVMVVALAVAPVAKGEVLVDLVPDRPGAYSGGESLTVDVWLHSEVSSDVRLKLVQFDFSDTDPGLGLDPTFTFDFSSLPAVAYQTHPELPVPWTVNLLECVCPEAFLLLPAGGSLHIGSIGVRFPTDPGGYRLDALNADELDPSQGAMLNVRGPVLRAFTGEITGGSFDFVVTPAIPTLSEWGLGAMASLLLALGCWTIARRTYGAKATGPYGDKIRDATHARCQGASPRVSALTAICSAALSLGISTTVVAQPAPIASKTVAVSIDSGIVSATGVGAGPVAVFSQLVSVDGGPWIRLHFAQVQLSGSTETANESYLRITSLEDGAVQTLDSVALGRWRNTSAYFNGDSVLVELLAHRNTGANRVAIEKIVAGVQSELDSPSAICGADDRVSSTDPRAGRIIPGGCTAFLFNDHARCLLTAGHCPFFGGMDCVEFNVPPSECDGTINHPGPEDQYPIDQASIQYQITTDPFLGPGDDWAYFGVFDNTTDPQNPHSPLQKQGASYQLVPIVPDADGSTLRITGYGLDKTPVGCCDAPACTTCGAFACGFGQRNEDSQTEQTDSGPYQSKVGTTVAYVIDTTGGNSGSAVEHEGQGLVYAIHTHGGCTATGGANKGTAVDHPGLQDALACPIGVCAGPAGGACCRSDGSCVLELDSCCTADGGTFQGAGTTCTPLGTCCVGGGSCISTTSTCCANAGGSFSSGTTCQIGACCLPDGSCTNDSEPCCNDAGGCFAGAGTSCASETCGACCPAPFGNCFNTHQDCCDAQGGLFDPGNFCHFLYPCAGTSSPSQGP